LKDEFLPLHLGFLEKFLVDTDTLSLGGDKPNAADVTFFAVFGVYQHAGMGADEVLMKFPKLKGAYEAAKTLGKLADFKRDGHYFIADPEHAMF
jgi:glutathione S-transferase